MAKTQAPARTPSFPRRDADGRIPTMADMLAGVAFSMIIGIVLVLAIDGLVTLLGRGQFGSFSGWIAGVLAAWMFVEDFRAWRTGPAKYGVALISLAVALLAGVGVGLVVGGLPRVFSGAISVAIAAIVYAVVWFFGIRAVADRSSER